MNSSELRRLSFSDLKDVLAHSRNVRFNLLKNSKKQSHYCYACGESDGFIFVNIINDDLAKEWDLTKDLRKSFDVRESTKCKNCGSSLRSNLHAKTILKLLAPRSANLDDAIKDKQFSKLKIAEINACGALHKIMAEHPNLKYSEFMPQDKTIHHENLDKLSYPDNYFDAVFTSETLEHVPDWRQAAGEIHRVLKPGGLHIFTVPTILTRKTRTRAIREKDKVKNLLPPSHHGYNRGTTSDYIVFNEFGADLRKYMDELGFETNIYFRNFLRLSDPNFVFVSVKV